MKLRQAMPTVVGVLFTVLLTVLLAGIFAALDGQPPLSAFFDSAPRLVFSTLGLTFVVWAALVAVGAARTARRSARRAYIVTVLVTVGCIVVTLLGWFVVALVAGGWALFLVVVSLLTSLFFLASAAFVFFLVYFVIFPRPAAVPIDSGVQLDAAIE